MVLRGFVTRTAAAVVRVCVNSSSATSIECRANVAVVAHVKLAVAAATTAGCSAVFTQSHASATEDETGKRARARVYW